MNMKKTIAFNSKRQRVISEIGIPKQDDEAEHKHSHIPLMSELPEPSDEKMLSPSLVPLGENTMDMSFKIFRYLKMHPAVIGCILILMN
jgi:hypothetical protein